MKVCRDPRLSPKKKRTRKPRELDRRVIGVQVLRNSRYGSYSARVIYEVLYSNVDKSKSLEWRYEKGQFIRSLPSLKPDKYSRSDLHTRMEAVSVLLGEIEHACIEVDDLL